MIKVTTVSDIRTLGSQLVNVSNPIIEPLNATEHFQKKLARFGDHYDTSNSSHLYRYLISLCGESGAGSLKKELLSARLQSMLESTSFLDLDRLYGNPLAFPRLSEEIYDIDPEDEILTAAQWIEIRAKDASYRQRSLLWMRAIIEGGTPLGIQLAAEAALGVECDIFENYRSIENPTLYRAYAQTSSRNEFIIIPRTTTITQQERRRVAHLVDKIKPTNSLQTVYAGNAARTLISISDLASSSNQFYVLRLVTGRSDITWPEIDLSKGYWIEAAIEKEAPTFAFMDRQESVTYLSVTDVDASSFHVGNFNKVQQDLFSHLTKTLNTDYAYSPDRAFAQNIAPINLSIPWIAKNNTPGNSIVVNNHFPIEYFALSNISASVTATQESFWASVEKLPPEQDTLTFDFGRVRPINFIDFQICQKPIDFEIEYDNAGVWTPIVLQIDRPSTMAADYLPSESSPWYYFKAAFERVQTQKIRITFTRRDQAFPFEGTDAFKWSIEIRDARFIHTMTSANDFIADTGTDVLGNSFRTTLNVYAQSNVTDNDETTYWQSKPNPSRFAVEALYFDLGSSPVVDEIYIDPITFGPDMHFYYSDDTLESDWDEKLWVPIPRHYVLKRGYHALPLPTQARFFKIEFSNLSVTPYESIEYPELSPVQYRKFPSWVQDYFNGILDRVTESNATNIVNTIAIDPLVFGFQRIQDRMISSYESERVISLTEPTEIEKMVTNVIEGQKPDLRSDVEDKIRYKSPIMWQADLVAQLDPSRALSRVAQAPREQFFDTGWNAELGLPIFDTPTQASSTNLDVALEEKTRPIMWFPRRTRHTYQIVEAPFEHKLAYFVAIREVSFHRRDYTTELDERLYYETLEDYAHVAYSDFVDAGDGRFIIGA